MPSRKLYSYTNLIYLKDGSAVQLKRPYLIKNNQKRLLKDNHNQEYLNKLNPNKLNKYKQDFKNFKIKFLD